MLLQVEVFLIKFCEATSNRDLRKTCVYVRVFVFEHACMHLYTCAECFHVQIFHFFLFYMWVSFIRIAKNGLQCIISAFNQELCDSFSISALVLRRLIFFWRGGGGGGYRDESHNSPPPSSRSQHDCSLSGFGSEPGRTALFVPKRAAGLAALEQYAQRTEQRCKCGPSQLWSRPCFTTLIHCCLPDYSAPCNPSLWPVTEDWE